MSIRTVTNLPPTELLKRDPGEGLPDRIQVSLSERHPVLQWIKHVSKAEHVRLRQYPGAHGWRGVSFLGKYQLQLLSALWARARWMGESCMGSRELVCLHHITLYYFTILSFIGWPPVIQVDSCHPTHVALHWLPIAAHVYTQYKIL